MEEVGGVMLMPREEGMVRAMPRPGDIPAPGGIPSLDSGDLAGPGSFLAPGSLIAILSLSSFSFRFLSLSSRFLASLLSGTGLK